MYLLFNILWYITQSLYSHRRWVLMFHKQLATFAHVTAHVSFEPFVYRTVWVLFEILYIGLFECRRTVFNNIKLLYLFVVPIRCSADHPLPVCLAIKFVFCGLITQVWYEYIVCSNRRRFRHTRAVQLLSIP